MSMTLNQLNYVIEVNKCGTINKAAANLFTSQSVLSTSIRNLEAELGRDIFIRSPKGVTLTPFGHTFLNYIIPIHHQLKQLDDMIEKNTSYGHTFSIASNGFYFINNICSELYHGYKNEGIHIKQYDAFGNEIMSMVSRNIAEIGLLRIWDCYDSLMSRQFDTLHLDFLPIATLNLGITIGPTHPHFTYPEESIDPELLAPYPAVRYEHLDSGPYADIYKRLHLPATKNRIGTSSRAAIYETLDDTDAYFLNSYYNEYYPSGCPAHVTRTLLLKDCTIHSKIGWIINRDNPPGKLAIECMEILGRKFPESARYAAQYKKS